LRVREPFRYLIGVRFGNKCKAWSDSPELDLILVILREVLRAVVHPQHQATGVICTDRAVTELYGHGKLLQCGKPVAMFGQVFNKLNMEG